MPLEFYTGYASNRLTDLRFKGMIKLLELLKLLSDQQNSTEEQKAMQLIGEALVQQQQINESLRDFCIGISIALMVLCAVLVFLTIRQEILRNKLKKLIKKLDK